MFKGFRDFIMRGNVVDLAVGVVIGAAFTSIVSSFTDDLIQPLINAAGSVGDVDAATAGLGFYILPGVEGTYLNFGAVITAAINFLLVAAVVYFVIVLPMNKLNSMRESKEEQEDAEVVTETALLTEIRNLLAQANESTNTGRNAISTTDESTETKDPSAGTASSDGSTAESGPKKTD